MNQFDNVKKIFLLGGHDLEMMTIKSILKQKNHVVKDKELGWSDAKLSKYEEELKVAQSTALPDDEDDI